MLINGTPSKEFKMERGLRQGDPLSPFLFLIVAEALQVMTMEACNKGIFKGLTLDDGQNISLLQYADDALFFGEWSVANARYLVRILNLFHDVSGLKINLVKSRIFGIGIPMGDVANVARAINCSYGSLPFSYLGLPVGKSMNKVDAWNDVVGKLSKRLATWKINLLSIGGRLTLVKSVLGSLPLYYLSIFRAPISVISHIEALRRRFFWGFKENEKKIFWVRWQKILAGKKDDGLGVGSIKAKNMSLLGKWRWRYLNETGALWRKVISKIHGSDGGFEANTGSRKKAGVWANIIGCCSELNQMGISLNNLIVKKVSSGNQTSFWSDAWIKDLGPLKFRFPRLFALETNINCLVAERWDLINGVWQGTWAWRRQPTGRALDELTSLFNHISGLVLDISREDNWSWLLNQSGSSR